MSLEMPRQEAHMPGLAMEEESVLPAVARSMTKRDAHPWVS